MCKHPPSSEALGVAVSLVFSDDSTTNQQKLKLVELLLSSGAKGDGLAATLIHVTELCTRCTVTDAALNEMLKLLVKFNRSLNMNNSEVVKVAIPSTQLYLIDIFLDSRNFNADIATVAFTAIYPAANRSSQLTILSRLLEKGAHGTPLHEALIYAVKTDYNSAVEVLVVRSESNKASVDYKHAAALKDAVFRGRNWIWLSFCYRAVQAKLPYRDLFDIFGSVERKQGLP